MEYKVETKEHPAYSGWSWITCSKIIISGATSERYKELSGFTEQNLCIDTGVGQNCGTAVLYRVNCLAYYDEKELQEIYAKLKVWMTSDYRTERIAPFKYNQIFFFHRTDLFEYDENFSIFKEVFKPTIVSTWQSNSEPNHTTSMFMINLKD